jgi:hypothetical protein
VTESDAELARKLLHVAVLMATAVVSAFALPDALFKREFK